MRKKFKETLFNAASVVATIAIAFGLLTPAFAAASETVTITKYVDGVVATASSSGSAAFPIAASWNATNLGAGTGTFNLGPSAFNSSSTPYTAVTAAMDPNASYSLSETLGTSLVGADCSTGATYRLVGYSVGNTLANAAAGSVSTTAPSLTNLNANTFVIVRNRHCVPTPTNLSPINGSSTAASPTTVFDWNDVTSAVGGINYFFQLSSSSTTDSNGAFTSTVVSQGSLPTSQVTLNNLPAGTYFWHVLAQDAAQNISTYSPTWTLTITPSTPITPTPTSTVEVHILKYLNGAEASGSSANGYQFPMASTWQAGNLNGGAQSSGTYVLGNNFGGSSHQYGADTAPMNVGASYATNEKVDNGSQTTAPGVTCPQGMYQLQGYTTSSTSFADAASKSPTTSVPSFSNLQNDAYVIVWNNSCGTTTPVPPPPPVATSTGTLTIVKIALGGNGTFNFRGNHSITNFSITTNNSVGSSVLSLAPGRYNIQEQKQSGWMQLLNTCRNVVVRSGKTSVCLVVNQIRPQMNQGWGQGWGQNGQSQGNQGNQGGFLGGLFFGGF